MCWAKCSKRQNEISQNLLVIGKKNLTKGKKPATNAWSAPLIRLFPEFETGMEWTSKELSSKTFIKIKIQSPAAETEQGSPLISLKDYS